MTHINTTNNNNFYITIPMKHFPIQDLTHLTSEFKKSIVDTCSREGFKEAVRQMLGSMYVNPDQPHNMNVIISEGGGNTEHATTTTTTHVFRDRQWRLHDTGEAIAEMLEEHGEAIRNFPDEISGNVDIPQETIDEIDRAYDASEHLGNSDMEASLLNLACERVRMFERDVLGKYRNVLEGISVARAAQSRRAAAVFAPRESEDATT
jgi:hypothetical protein